MGRKMRGQFMRIPVDVAAASISSFAKLVYAALDMFDGDKGCFPKLTSVAEKLNLPYWRVKRAIRELKENGFIEAWRDPGFNNHYRLFGDHAVASPQPGTVESPPGYSGVPTQDREAGDSGAPTRVLGSAVPGYSGVRNNRTSRSLRAGDPARHFLAQAQDLRNAAITALQREGAELQHAAELGAEEPRRPTPESTYEIEADLLGREMERLLQKAGAA